MTVIASTTVPAEAHTATKSKACNPSFWHPETRHATIILGPQKGGLQLFRGAQKRIVQQKIRTPKRGVRQFLRPKIRVKSGSEKHSATIVATICATNNYD